jgi:2C-methyl-D-erythritol 2,4-cyclodiphosphate synthase
MEGVSVLQTHSDGFVLVFGLSKALLGGASASRSRTA